MPHRRGNLFWQLRQSMSYASHKQGMVCIFSRRRHAWCRRDDTLDSLESDPRPFARFTPIVRSSVNITVTGESRPSILNGYPTARWGVGYWLHR